MLRQLIQDLLGEWIGPSFGQTQAGSRPGRIVCAVTVANMGLWLRPQQGIARGIVQCSPILR